MLKSITLESFKSFRKATLPLGPFTLLVGTNASGKSNLRDAFRFLHGIGRGYSLAEILGEKWGEGGELQWKGIRGGMREIAFGGGKRFTVRVKLTPPPVSPGPGPLRRLLDYAITVDVSHAKAGPRVVRESLWSGQRMFFDSHPEADAPKQRNANHLTLRLPRGGRHRRMGAALEVLSSATAIAQVPGRDDVGVATERQSIAGARALQSMRFLDLSPDATRAASPPGQHVLGDRGENLSSVLQAICDEAAKKKTLLEWIRALTPLDVTDLAFPQDFSGRVLVHLVESGGRQVSAPSASDGTLRFLAMLAALLGPDASRFYFFEEIENGIHPTRLHLLVQLIEQQCRTGTVQIVATTHSPQLLSFLSEESRESAALAYRLEGSDESKIIRIAELPEVERVLETQDLARLHASGWLEDMVELMADEGSKAAE